MALIPSRSILSRGSSFSLRRSLRLGCWLMALGAAGCSDGDESGAAGSSGQAGNAGTTAAGNGGAGAGGEAGADAGGNGGADAGGNGGTDAGGNGGTDAGGNGGTQAGGNAGTQAGGEGGSGGDAGTAGVGGGAGSAGSAGGLDAVQLVGAPCVTSDDCGPGGTCLEADKTKFYGGGPPHGYCTIDCTSWLSLTTAEKLATPYPCDPSVDVSSDVPGRNICLDFTTNKPLGLCMQTCTFGAPPLTSFDMTLDPGKCGGRTETACTPLMDEDYQFLGVSFCQPMCQADSDCPDGKKCDPTGVCMTKVVAKKKTGERCDYADDSYPCEGYCQRLYSPSDPSVPAAKKNAGICISSCITGLASSCGGPESGVCGFNSYAPRDPETKQVVEVGAGDYGGCIEVSPGGDDTQCLWQDRWFTRTVAPSVTACVPAPACNVDADCAGEGEGLTCRKVDAVCGLSFCLDHEVTGLPAGDPLVVCE